MINIITAVIVGTVIGSVLTYFYTRSKQAKQLKSSRQEIFDQCNHTINQLKEQNRSLESLSQTRLEEKETLVRNQSLLQAQIVTQQENYRQMQSSYEKKLTAESNHCIQLQQKCEIDKKAAREASRENVSLALQQSESVESENGLLKAKNKRLTLENDQLRAMLKQEETQHEEALKIAHQEPDIDIGEIVRDLFPNLELLRNSVDEINRNKGDIVAILHRLKALDSKNFEYSKKIHSTGKEWFECKVGMIRLYFRKDSASPMDKCEVLISRKKDRKSQDKDLDWLKQQPKKR